MAIAGLKSSTFRMFSGSTSTFKYGDTAWITPNCAGPVGVVALRNTATRFNEGAISLSNSSHLAAIAYSYIMNPVTLPPGRARLSTWPAATGSPITGNTMGTVRVF
jgi:hypothetical protein